MFSTLVCVLLLANKKSRSHEGIAFIFQSKLLSFLGMEGLCVGIPGLSIGIYEPILTPFHSVDYFLCRCLLVDQCLSRTWFWSLRHYSQFTISTRAKSASCGDMHSLNQWHTHLLTAFTSYKRDDPQLQVFDDYLAICSSLFWSIIYFAL